MKYMERSAFEGVGIQELSREEIAFVSGGKQKVAPKAIVKPDDRLEPTGGTQPYYSIAVNIAGSHTYPKADRCAVAGNMAAGGGVLQGAGFALSKTPAAPLGGVVVGFGAAVVAVGSGLYLLNDCGEP